MYASKRVSKPVLTCTSGNGHRGPRVASARTQIAHKRNAYVGTLPNLIKITYGSPYIRACRIYPAKRLY